MIAMRNVLVHRYGSVDAVIVWDIVTNKLPVVLEQLIPLTSAHDELGERAAEHGDKKLRRTPDTDPCFATGVGPLPFAASRSIDEGDLLVTNRVQRNMR